MSKRHRRNLDRALKAKVALVAVKGEKTLAELATARQASFTSTSRFSQRHDQPAEIHLS
ncbi:MAG: hypothetical protein WC804_01075 [Sphingomonas sp.]|jgi:hypothetical protein|uniref:hypothetical protein n=1 Tax=Sphingomonas sp. TaxID=28214 RepID=UPI00356372C3